MTHLGDARVFDLEDKPTRAVECYEAAIAKEEVGLEVYLDLAVLYAECTDGGYSASNNLSLEFLQRASRRARELLEVAEQKFGAFNEIDFWRYYFDYRAGGEEDFELVLALAKLGPSKVPYFQVYKNRAGGNYKNEAIELYSQVKGGKTLKERYIKSVLESIFLAREKGMKPFD